MIRCPIHGLIPAPGSGMVRGEWSRRDGSWFHICGREERGKENPQNQAEIPVTREPARP